MSFTRTTEEHRKYNLLLANIVHADSKNNCHIPAKKKTESSPFWGESMLSRLSLLSFFQIKKTAMTLIVIATRIRLFHQELKRL